MQKLLTEKEIKNAKNVSIVIAKELCINNDPNPTPTEIKELQDLIEREILDLKQN